MVLKKPLKKELVRLNVQLKTDQYEALRRLSFETRKSQAEIIRLALEKHLKEAKKTDMKKFFETETYTIDRGYKVHVSRAPEYATQAVVEDGDGKKTMVEVGHREWADFDDFLDVVVEEYESGVKKLSAATLGDTVDHKCEFCGRFLELHEVDRAENLAWLSCPGYLAGGDEHTSYSVPISETGER